MKNVLKYSGVMWVSRAPTGVWHCNTQALVGGQEPTVSSMGAVGRVSSSGQIMRRKYVNLSDLLRGGYRSQICTLRIFLSVKQPVLAGSGHTVFFHRTSLVLVKQSEVSQKA